MVHVAWRDPHVAEGKLDHVGGLATVLLAPKYFRLTPVANHFHGMQSHHES